MACCCSRRESPITPIVIEFGEKRKLIISSNSKITCAENSTSSYRISLSRGLFVRRTQNGLRGEFIRATTTKTTTTTQLGPTSATQRAKRRLFSPKCLLYMYTLNTISNRLFSPFREMPNKFLGKYFDFIYATGFFSSPNIFINSIVRPEMSVRTKRRCSVLQALFFPTKWRKIGDRNENVHKKGNWKKDI